MQIWLDQLSESEWVVVLEEANEYEELERMPLSEAVALLRGADVDKDVIDVLIAGALLSYEEILGWEANGPPLLESLFQ